MDGGRARTPAASPASRPDSDAPWDAEADVVVVGFGAAGACTALAAAETGSDVLVLDRFSGGGASALSGGVVYAGGGTTQQRAAGVTDSTEAMYQYLRLEAGDVVSPETLRRFCDGSVEMLDWLAGYGVPFDASLCPDKTSYPTNRHYLYYSGSEVSFQDTVPPAPRGHRTYGKGTSGKLMFARLRAAVQAKGVRLAPQTRAQELITDAAGRVIGVECRTLGRWARLPHRVLDRWSRKPFLYVPKLGRLLHRPVTWLERRHSVPMRIRARRGVVLSAGGFVNNRQLMRAHAPAFRGGLPLGTPGDDGSGIQLGMSAGGATAHLDRISVWRFLTPPEALLSGVLVDAAGARIMDESRYGAAIGEAIVTAHNRTAWLLVDDAILRSAVWQLRTQAMWFQRLSGWLLLRFGKVTAPTIEQLAAKAGISLEGLQETLAAYDKEPGKPAQFVRPIENPPYSLIDCSIRPRLAYPAPMLTLGGLMVSEQTGQVLGADGSPVPGLFAAGRSAVGICSNSYVSGLSLADCVFSGRRAGAHAAA